jgi:hypothetical protein
MIHSKHQAFLEKRGEDVQDGISFSELVCHLPSLRLAPAHSRVLPGATVDIWRPLRCCKPRSASTSAARRPSPPPLRWENKPSFYSMALQACNAVLC